MDNKVIYLAKNNKIQILKINNIKNFNLTMNKQYANNNYLKMIRNKQN